MSVSFTTSFQICEKYYGKKVYFTTYDFSTPLKLVLRYCTFVSFMFTHAIPPPLAISVCIMLTGIKFGRRIWQAELYLELLREIAFVGFFVKITSNSATNRPAYQGYQFLFFFLYHLSSIVHAYAAGKERENYEKLIDKNDETVICYSQEFITQHCLSAVIHVLMLKHGEYIYMRNLFFLEQSTLICSNYLNFLLICTF